MEGIKETSVFVSSIFEETPKQWISLEDFEKRFKEVFEKFTGAPLTRECHMFLSKYAHGGMSSGMISVQFFREALNIIKENFNV